MPNATALDHAPTLWIIAGPNGVGKTTYAMRHIAEVSGSLEFLNQDETARGLYPLAPASQKALRAAGRVSARRRKALLRRRESFALKSTLSGRAYLRVMDQASAAGYRVHLLYFFVRSPEESARRVARRLESGGHDFGTHSTRRTAQPLARALWPAHAKACTPTRGRSRSAAGV